MKEHEMRSRLIITTLLCGTIMSAYALPGKNAEALSSRLESLKAGATNNEAPVDKNKASYSVGYTLGSNLSKQFSEINEDEFFNGLKDAFSGKEGRFDKQEMSRAIMSFQREIMKKRMEERKAQAEKNKKEGDAFIEAKKKEKGVKVTDSGLVYKVIKEGKGTAPAATDKVKVTYQGTLIDGTEFSSQTDVANPAEFNLSAVIPAWREALQLMKPGATWELYVPPNLAYGARGTAGDIGPNATLIFKINLISVEKPSAEAKNASDKSSQLSRSIHKQS